MGWSGGQCPVADIHLLTENGSPKTVRLFPDGHMGLTPKTLPTIVDWLVRQVCGQGVTSQWPVRVLPCPTPIAPIITAVQWHQYQTLDPAISWTRGVLRELGATHQA